MNRKALLVVAMATAGPWCLGADTDLGELTDRKAYDRLWNAALEVMKKHFHVRYAEKKGGRIVADSMVRNTTGRKTRVKVEAKIVRDDDYFYDVEVRVTNQMDTSEPSALSRRQSRYLWYSVGFDQEAETKLVNEIKDQAFGKPKPFPSNQSPFGSPRGREYPPSRIVIPAKPTGTKQKATKYQPRRRSSHLLLIMVPNSRPNKDVVPLVVRGEDEFRKGRYAVAASTFREALMTDPHPAVKFALGHALFAKGDYGFAAAALREGLRGVSDGPARKLDTRQFYGAALDYEAHRKRLEKWLAEHPDDKQAKFLMGYVCYFGGDLDRAQAIFSELLSANADDAAVKPFMKCLSDRAKAQPTVVQAATTTDH